MHALIGFSLAFALLAVIYSKARAQAQFFS
jgi:hypothetical protein